MKNSLVAQILKQLADYSEMEDDQPYRARAYRRAAQTIETMKEDVFDLWKSNKLQELPGVGENIEKKIDEILRTGKLEILEKIKQRIPVDVASLTKIEGIGPKTVMELNKELGIRNVDDFENAVREGKLSSFRGLGVKSKDQLLERIQNSRAQSSRVLLAKGLFLADRVLGIVAKIPNVKRYAAAGSLRRMKETIGDLDILIETDDPVSSIDSFTSSDEIREVNQKGDLKASVKIDDNFQVDVRVVPSRSWGAALLYFTGSKSHNIELRTIAIRKGLRLNEYGLFRAGEQMVAGLTEEDVYAALGLDYIEPELREDRGEIQSASNHILPKLIRLKDIKGDLQMHTEWSDGRDTVEKMAETCRKMGYEYIAITDHIGSLKVANALDESRIKEQKKIIDGLNKKYESGGIDFHIIQGAEVNVKADGKLDMKDSVLKEFDLVLGAIHSGFKDDVNKIMMRMNGALENENVDIIAHPTGRLLLERTGYPVDIPALVDKAISTETVLEIDGHPNRLDLSDENALTAIRAGCTLSVDTDSHESTELEYMRLGVSQARRAWTTKESILNTRSYKDVMKFLGN